MLPVRIVLAVEDEQYIEPFLHYVRCSEYDRRLMITAFSRKEAFLQFLKECGDSVDAVLGESSFLESTGLRQEGRIRFIRLVDSGKENSNDRDLAKYQPLHMLLSSLLDLIRDKGPEREGRAKVIGITSAVGGLGKTTVAMNLARQLSAEGHKVFYLNLEAVQAGDSERAELARGGGNRPGLARLLYDLKAAEDRREVLKTPVASYAYRHPILQGDAFMPLDNPDELLELGSGDTADLLDYIAGSGLYDLVIVDTDTFPNDRTDAILEMSDKLVWLLADDWSVMRKTGVCLDHLERSRPALFNAIMGKALFAASRVTGELTVPLPRKGMVVEAMLPFIPSWNQGTRHGGVMHSPVYQRDLMRLCLELTDRRTEHAG